MDSTNVEQTARAYPPGQAYEIILRRPEIACAVFLAPAEAAAENLGAYRGYPRAISGPVVPLARGRYQRAALFHLEPSIERLLHE